MAAVVQPSGTVTLVFTDIEGSTRLLEELGVDAYRAALGEHRRVVREACARHEGYEVDYEGDAFFYAFASASDAVGAVSEAMVGLQPGPIRVRVGIHTGEPALDPPKYVGLDVHRAARIMASAHGGQVVLSPSTVSLLEPESVQLRELGQHRLKDLSSPIPLHQLQIDGLVQEFPPLKTLYRSNLPVPATPFLGREQELAQVVQRLTDPSTRLLTLTGPGGTGKTRLALHAAAEASDEFPDGVHWVPLAPLRDPTSVVSELGRVLDVRERADEDPVETVARALLGKRTLLVLDNAEHLLPGLALELARFTAVCPTIRVLVTSRERLGIGVECVWPVPQMSESDGERLFVERASAVGVELPVDEMVRELCRALDELPLGIELAAARTVVFSPVQLLERLGQRLDLLKGGRDADPRQQTLRATIDWSYRLLDHDEQRVYRVLSVFAGGCTLDAAEQVARADVDALQSLLDKSLLRRRADEAGLDRYWMLETIREHAADRLHAEHDDEQARARHLDWCAALADELGDEVRASEPGVLGRWRADAANMAVACETALATDQVEPMATLFHGQWWVWLTSGQLRQGLRLTRRIAELPATTPAHADALSVAGEMLRFVGEYRDAIELKERALSVYETTGSGLLMQTLTDTAEAYIGLGDEERAALLAERSLRLRHEAGVPVGVAHALTPLILLALRRGDYTQALEHATTARQIVTDDEHWSDAAEACVRQASALRRLDRAGDAARALLDAAELVEQVSDRFVLVQVLEEAAALTAQQVAAADRAGTILGHAIALRRETGAAPYDPREHARLLEGVEAACGVGSLELPPTPMQFADLVTEARDALQFVVDGPVPEPERRPGAAPSRRGR